MKNFINIAIAVYVGAALLLLLPACSGQSSNPMEKYKDLKVSTDTTTPSETQKIAPPDVFSVEVDGTNQVNNGQFIENEDGQMLVKVAPKSAKIMEYSVELTGFPYNDKPKIHASSTAGVYALLWKPNAGIIPPGVWGTPPLQAQLTMTVTKATDNNLVGLAKVQNVTIVVSRNSAQPKILGRTKLDAGIDEGQAVPLSIDIEDPATATSPRIPEIQITPYIYSNTEAFRDDGTRFVRLDFNHTQNPERISATRWRFYYKLQVDQLAVDRDRRGDENPKSPSVDVCFQMRAVSVVGTLSSQEQVCFKGRYAAQLPVLQWEDEATKEIKSGVETQLKFITRSANGVGKTEIKEMQKQLATLTGKKEIQCAANNPLAQDIQSCALTWTPTCSRTSSSKKINLKVDHVIGAKTKTQSFTREMNILSNEELCPAPKSKPVAAPVKETSKAQIAVKEAATGGAQ